MADRQTAMCGVSDGEVHNQRVTDQQDSGPIGKE